MVGAGEMTPRDWCRDFIDHNCFLRCPPGQRLILSPDGKLNTWQIYMPIAMLDQQFAEYMVRMFWQHFADKGPFQICACESGGIPLMCAIQARHNVPGFVFRKKAKDYGIKNWLEGVVDPDLPVLLVDDGRGTGKTLRTRAERLVEFGLKLHPEMFVIATFKKVGPQTIEVGEQEHSLVSLFDASDFARTWEEYVAKYKRQPQFVGTIV
jgi:orotate phosphoribosyltransferase